MSSKLILENGNNVIENDNFKVIFKKLSVPLEPFERVKVFDIEIVEDGKNPLSFSLSQLIVSSPTQVIFEYSLDFAEVTSEDFLIKIYSSYPTFDSIATDCIEYYRAYKSKILVNNDFSKFNSQKKSIFENLKKLYPGSASIRFNGYVGSLIAFDFSPKLTIGAHVLLGFYDPESSKFSFINSVSSFESFLNQNSAKITDSFFNKDNLQKILGIFGSISQISYQYALIDNPKALEFSAFYLETDSEIVESVKKASLLVRAPVFENNSLTFCAFSINYPVNLYQFKISKSGSVFKITSDLKMEKIYLPSFVSQDFSK